MQDSTVSIRFYEELNDFLPAEKRKQSYTCPIHCHPSVKDCIEAQGVPHTEVDLILVNGASVNFEYQLQDKDMVSVYPVFESLDISSITRLREKPLRDPTFILDVHLGKLARYLRLLGFDSLYRNDYDDAEIADISAATKRIVLTRDIGLLKRRIIHRGYWVRSQQAEAQLKEVVHRFDLKGSICPFQFCMRCNGRINTVSKAEIAEKLQPRTKAFYDTFYQCASCNQVYWQGNHFPRLQAIIERCY